MEEFQKLLDMAKDKNTERKDEAIILQPFEYMQDIPGKKISTVFPKAINFWLNIPEDKLLAVEEIVKILRSSSLLFDDIEDDSTTRRGIPSAHVLYGLASTINAANYACGLALQKTQNLGNSKATKIFIDEFLVSSLGQGMEIYWRDNNICPTELEYKLMAIRKTGGLMMFTVRLMQLFSKNKKDFTKLIAILAIYYQIWDDYRNLTFKEGYSDDKSVAEDLTEGKFGFPILHAAQRQHQLILHIVRQKTRDVTLKKYCITLLEELGSFDYTKEVLVSLDKEARAEIQRLGNNPLMDLIVNKMHSSSKSDNDETKFSAETNES